MEHRKTNQTSASTAADVVVKAAEAAKSMADTASSAVVAEVVSSAAIAAKIAAEESDEKIVNSLSQALRNVFGENEKAGRFIDVSRIPLICKDIGDIREHLGDMREMMKTNEDRFVNKDQFWPVKSLVYGATGIILTGVVLALIYLVVKIH